MRKRKDFVRLEGVRSARLVVIASEGRCTESIYFSAVKIGSVRRMSMSRYWPVIPMSLRPKAFTPRLLISCGNTT